MASKDVRESNRREVLTGKEMPIAGNGDKKTSSPREVGSAREGGGTPPVPVKARALNRSACRSRVLLLPPPSLLLLHRRRRLPPRRGGTGGCRKKMNLTCGSHVQMRRWMKNVTAVARFQFCKISVVRL